MTPPKPFGSIAVPNGAKPSVSQPMKQSNCDNPVGGVMTPPYVQIVR